MRFKTQMIRSVLIVGTILLVSPLYGVSAHAVDAASFFRKDKTVWSNKAVSSSRSVRRSTRSRATGLLRLRGSRGRFAAAERRAGVPIRVALAVIAVESRGNCRAVGRRGELGPLQIKPQTARGLGFRGSNAALRSCGAGLYWGMKHLAISYRKCGSAVLHNKGLAGSCRGTAYSRKVRQLARRI